MKQISSLAAESKSVEPIIKRIVVATILVATFAALAVLFYVSIPLDWQDTAVAFHVPLALSTIGACLPIGAALIFVMSFRSYKSRVRRAYAAIVVSMVLCGLGGLQLPIINAFNLWNTAWINDGIITIPFVFSGLAAYAGTRKFAHIVGIETIFTKARVMMPAVILVAYMSSFLPHVPLVPPTSELEFHIANGILVWSASLYLLAGLVILQVKQRIGVRYIKAMAWLSLGMLGVALLTTTGFVDVLVSTSIIDPSTYVVDTLVIVVGAMFMKTGYEFYRITDY